MVVVAPRRVGYSRRKHTHQVIRSTVGQLAKFVQDLSFNHLGTLRSGKGLRSTFSESNWMSSFLLLFFFNGNPPRRT